MTNFEFKTAFVLGTAAHSSQADVFAHCFFFFKSTYLSIAVMLVRYASSAVDQSNGYCTVTCMTGSLH